jgi:hypothetical protein
MAVANALAQDVRSMLLGEKTMLLDSTNGSIYAYGMDRSLPPKRSTVPPESYAHELLQRAEKTTGALPYLMPKLLGLGRKAHPAIERAVQSPNPYVVDVAAQTLGIMNQRESVPALIKGLELWLATPLAATSPLDPVLRMVQSLADLKDARAVGVLTTLLRDETRDHQRRRAAYVALGAIGTPESLLPVWAFRGSKTFNSMQWDPQAYTASFADKVEEDIPASPEEWPEALRKDTSLTTSNSGAGKEKSGGCYRAALSPYLGGINDLWIGKCNGEEIMSEALFTGYTHPEVLPQRRIRLQQFKRTKPDEFQLMIQTAGKPKAEKAQTLTFNLAMLQADGDGDTLPDLVERRLQLCQTHVDCDGDGLKDAEDLNPLASQKNPLTVEQQLYREAFFTFFAPLKRRGIVVVDPGEGPAFELYGRRDPILSLRRKTIEQLRQEAGLQAMDYVSFGGPYAESGGRGEGSPKVIFDRQRTLATLGMEIYRSADNAVAFNVTLRKTGQNWVVIRFHRAGAISPSPP